MPTTICPECSEEVYVDADCEQGDVISCEECATRLEVVGLDPIEVDVQAADDAEEREPTDDYDPYHFGDDHY